MKPVAPVAVLAALLAIALVTPAAPQARTPAPQARLADVALPGPPESVSIDLPLQAYSAYNAFVRVLEAADVRYGLEGPAWDMTAPPIDLAQWRARTELLGGRRLGDALDLIVKAAPEYRWTETSGLVIIRATAAGDGILDRVVPRLTLADASPRIALEQLIAVLDPVRPSGTIAGDFGRAGGSGAGAQGERRGRGVTLSLEGATLQTLLTTIARENGETSWTVRYDAAPASLDTASITLTELGQRVMAPSPRFQRIQAELRTSPNRVSLSGTLASTLSGYSERANVRVSVEEVAAQPGEITAGSFQIAGLPMLELPDDPALAIARIVALDSRYEWSQKGSRFHVRPKPGVPGRLAVLDRTVTSFSASSEPASTVIERAAQALGTVRPFTFGSEISPTRPLSAEAMATPIDVNVTGPLSVRDLFDAIADATGWSWTLRPNFSPGRPTTLSLQWRGRSVAPGGVGPAGSWSTGLSIMAVEDLSPAPAPTRTPSRRVPAAMDRTVPAMALEVNSKGLAFRQLAARAQVPMGIEDEPRPPASGDPRRLTRPLPPVNVGPGQFSDALYVLLERLPDFEIVSADGIVSVAPSRLVAAPDYLLNRRLDAFAVTGVGLFRAIGELRRTLDPRFEPRDWEGAGRGTLNRPVTLSVRNATVRDALNQLVRQHGGLVWTSTFEAAEARPESWVVTLVPIDNTGTPISMTASGGEPARPAATPFTTRPVYPPGTRPVTLDLPVTASSLRMGLGAAAQAAGAVLGFELVASTGPPSREPRTDYYDLTGLSMAEVLDKLRELAPDYTFTDDGGVLHVTPRSPQRDSTPWLNQRVERFERQFADLREAMNAVAMIRPTAARGGAPLPPPEVIGGSPSSIPGGRSGGVGPESLNDRLKKPLTISLTNVTVRDVLDEIARQFGGVHWVVEQRLNSPGFPISLMFSGQGFSIGTSVR